MEIARWPTDATEVRKDAGGDIVSYVFPILGCPLMCLELGFMEFVSSSDSTPFFFSFTSSDPILLLVALFSGVVRGPRSPVQYRGGERGGSRVIRAVEEGQKDNGEKHRRVEHQMRRDRGVETDSTEEDEDDDASASSRLWAISDTSLFLFFG